MIGWWKKMSTLHSSIIVHCYIDALASILASSLPLAVCLVLRSSRLQFLIICRTTIIPGGGQGLVMRLWNRLLEMKTRIMLSLISHLHLPLESMLYSQIFIWPWNKDKVNEYWIQARLCQRQPVLSVVTFISVQPSPAEEQSCPWTESRGDSPLQAQWVAILLWLYTHPL